MRARPLVAALLLASVFSIWSKLALAQQASVTVFENVRVLTMTEAGVLERGTVIVAGDRISSVTPSAAEPPPGARVIDGRSMTLLPGLADMHAHYNLAGVGPLFVINGITTVRETNRFVRFGFSPDGLDALAKAGALVGPHTYASGPLMDGANPTWEFSVVLTNPAEARGAVAAQAAAGFRAVKLYHGLDGQTFSAAVAAAHELDMQVWAHTPAALTYLDMLELGVDSIEHLWGTQYSLMGAPPNRELSLQEQGVVEWDGVDEARMLGLAASTQKAGLWNVPTLTVYTQLFEYATNADAFFARPDAKYVPPEFVQLWREQVEQSITTAMAAEVKRGKVARDRWVKALYEAGAGLLVGTDTPNPFIVPGFSFHEELANLTEAGIPSDALLRMATVEAARFLGEEGEFGIVAAGARADLILVEGDPSKELGVLRRPAYVMINGHLRDRASLQKHLDALPR